MAKYDVLETTAQRVYKYLCETITDEPQFIRYKLIADEVDCSRSAVSYAVGVLLKKGKIRIENGKIAVV